MALFTGTPVNIPNIDLNETGNLQGRFYSSAGAEYIVGVDKTSANDVIAKRSAGIWTTFDLGVATGYQQAVFDAVNNQIVVVAVSGGNLKTYSFACSSDSFSSVTTSSFSASQDPVSDIRPNGSVRAFFTGTGGALFAVSISAGAFGTPISMDAAATSIPGTVVSDSNGVFHCGYRRGTTFFYVTLDASDVSGTPATIATGASVSSLANARIFGDRIIFARSFVSPVRIYIGTPVSAPLWSILNLHSATAGIDDEGMTVVEQAGELKFLYGRSDFAAVSEVMQVRWDGTTLQSPEVFWDAIANPPTLGTAPFYLFDGVTGDFRSTLGVAVTCPDDLGVNYTVFLELVGAHINRMYDG